MAHIPDGVLAAPLLLGGGALTLVLLGLSLRRLDYEQIPQAAVLASTCFVASLVSVPVGPSSVHLLLNGLMGLLLGWIALPAILGILVLQLMFFGYGGLLTLGINALNIALPALLCAWWFRHPNPDVTPSRRFTTGALAGGLAVLLTGLLVGLSLALSAADLAPAAQIIALTYLPLALVEALITGAILAFLGRVAPELLNPEPCAHD